MTVKHSLLSPLERGVHVCFARTNTIPGVELYDKYFTILDSGERTRYERFYFDRDRISFLAAHALLRLTLSRYIPTIEPADWRFIHGEYGKPEIDPAICSVPLRFNLSHTNGMVACVVTLDRECGVDVEIMRTDLDVRSVAQQVFSESEISILDKLEGHNARNRFYELWTLKESFIKALGLGFSAPVKQISFYPDASPISMACESELADDPSAWIFNLHMPSENHKLAITVRNSLVNDLLLYDELIKLL